MLPESIADVAQLEDLLSEPTTPVIDALRELEGDILFLGVAGKMGPTLARMAKRASEAAGSKRRVIGVSRFSNAAEEQSLQSHRIETLRGDLLDENFLTALPDAPNVVFMAGMKFGATGNESLTWAMNTLLPALVCRRFARSRIAAFSTGNVYGLTPVADGGSKESDTPSPVGEYAMSCLGRERMFEHYSRAHSQAIALIRLNYACELRYGVLVDLAQKIGRGEAIELGMGHFNAIWQGDANAMSLLALARAGTPPFVVNVTGPELLEVRSVCAQLGKLLNKPVRFSGVEAPNALLSDARRAFELWGRPRVTTAELLPRIADWVRRGGATLGKPTHFESRDGKF